MHGDGDRRGRITGQPRWYRNACSSACGPWGQYRAGRSLPQIAGIAAGFAVLGLLPTLLVGLFYLAMGGWDEFWFANFVSFFLRAPAPMGRFADQYTIFVMPLVVLTVAGLYGSLRMTQPRDSRSYLFFCGMLAAALATVFLLTVYAYYFAALAWRTAGRAPLSRSRGARRNRAAWHGDAPHRPVLSARSP